MTEEDKVDLSNSDKIKTNEDGTVTVGDQTFASMEDFVGSIRQREKDLEGKE